MVTFIRTFLFLLRFHCPTSASSGSSSESEMKLVTLLRSDSQISCVLSHSYRSVKKVFIITYDGNLIELTII